MSKIHSTKFEDSQNRSYTNLKLSKTNNAKAKQFYNKPTQTIANSHTKMKPISNLNYKNSCDAVKQITGTE